jgi:hypothetical protein
MIRNRPIPAEIRFRLKSLAKSTSDSQTYQSKRPRTFCSRAFSVLPGRIK